MKKSELKEIILECINELNEQKVDYKKIINWIENEVDYVPDEKEYYEKWPEPWRTKALKALKNRSKSFSVMTKDKKRKFK